MRKNDDIIAIYSRKSKFTGKGESIGNQVELCKEYVRVHYGDTAVDKVAASIIILKFGRFRLPPEKPSSSYTATLSTAVSP